MSGEEDTELRDLVAQTLENNGVLSKIRAQLRASVFLALEEHESLQTKHPFQNKRLKEFLHTSEGVIAASLVKEFLEFFNLDYTLSVFEPESYCGSEFCPSSRSELASQLGLLDSSDTPLLALFMHNCSEQPQKQQINNKECVVNGNSGTEVRSDEEKCETPPKSATSSPQRLPSPVTRSTDAAKINNLTHTLEKLNVSTDMCPGVPESNSLPSIQPSAASQPLRETIKNILETGSPCESLDNYEEDFPSSVSGSQAEPAEQKASASEEIEEDVVSERGSTTSAVEEVTVDITMSLPDEIFADHFESI